EANPELPRRRDAGFRESLLHDLPSIEALQVGIASDGMRGRLAPEKAEERVALFAERAQSLPCAARVLAGDHADVVRERLPVDKPRGIADEHFGRQRRDGPTPGWVMSNVARGRSSATCLTCSSSRS